MVPVPEDPDGEFEDLALGYGDGDGGLLEYDTFLGADTYVEGALLVGAFGGGDDEDDGFSVEDDLRVVEP